MSLSQIGPEWLVYVDVGSLGGAKYTWSSYPQVYNVMFEPHSDQACVHTHNSVTLNQALSDHTGSHLLYLTQSDGCCSLLKPNFQFLKDYSVRRAFEVKDFLEVPVIPYMNLHAQAQVPVPDVIKIDVQGYEYQVLKGFGDLLDHVVAIELETSLYQIYEHQKTLPDILTYLAQFDFVLSKLNPITHWDGTVVEFDAVFTKHPRALNDMNSHAHKKLQAVIQELNLTPCMPQFSEEFVF